MLHFVQLHQHSFYDNGKIYILTKLAEKELSANILTANRLRKLIKISSEARKYLNQQLKQELIKTLEKAKLNAELSGRKTIQKQDIKEALKQSKKENILL